VRLKIFVAGRLLAVSGMALNASFIVSTSSQPFAMA
jgi:hypothetical protein